jgi:hypothetical protein
MKFFKFSFYRKYHKFIRRKLFDLSNQMARTNVCDDTERICFIQNLNNIKNLLEHHAHIEDSLIHKILENKFPTTYYKLLNDHNHIEKEFRDICESLQYTTFEKLDEWHYLYLRINRFIGEYLLHLDMEETKIMPFFLTNFTEDQLMKNKRKLRTDRQLQEFLTDVKEGIIDCNSLEQAEFLLEIKEHEHNDVFQEVQNTMVEALGHKTFLKVMDIMG